MTIHDFLKERGYQGPVKDQFRDNDVYFYRKVPNTTHQWVVYEHKVDMPNGPTYLGHSVEMCFETFDGTWVKNKFYGLSEEELRNKLDGLEQRLYDTIVPMGGNRKVYDGGWD